MPSLLESKSGSVDQVTDAKFRKFGHKIIEGNPGHHLILIKSYVNLKNRKFELPKFSVVLKCEPKLLLFTF